MVAEHAPTTPGDIHWGHVGDMKHVRERLMELAIGFEVAVDEDDARARIEARLAAAE